MKIGIVGLPNVGKSTFFNALTGLAAEAKNFPFTTIDPNIGLAAVPDERFDKLVEIFKPDKVTPAVVEFVDIAGIIKGAAAGEGLGNKFLSHIREVDAIVHVLRIFKDSDVLHVHGKISPLDDSEIIRSELTIADLDTVDRRIGKDRGPDEFLLKLKERLGRGLPAKDLETPDNAETIKELGLLTAKPVIYALNVGGDESQEEIESIIKEVESISGSRALPFSAKIESELNELSGDDRIQMEKELGISVRGLKKIIKASYQLLSLISFFTAGPTEVRAWTISEGSSAPEAAGKIHTDMQRGFIAAEVISYNEFEKFESFEKARAAGKIRQEGRGYIMKDGDIVVFKFNV